MLDCSSPALPVPACLVRAGRVVLVSACVRPESSGCGDLQGTASTFRASSRWQQPSMSVSEQTGQQLPRSSQSMTSSSPRALTTSISSDSSGLLIHQRSKGAATDRLLFMIAYSAQLNADAMAARDLCAPALRYVRESKAVQKISGYADSCAGDDARDEQSRPSDGTGALQPTLHYPCPLDFPTHVKCCCRTRACHCLKACNRNVICEARSRHIVDRVGFPASKDRSELCAPGPSA